MSKGKVATFQFDIEGMSCASCAARIEKVLSQEPGVIQASVNFAAKTATVSGGSNPEGLMAKVASLGYTATLANNTHELEEREQQALARAKHQTLLAILIALPVVILGMVAPDLPGSSLVQLLLTTVLLSGPGRGFFVRAVSQVRHLALGMDSLVSMGTSVSFLYSIYLMSLGHKHLYFESVAVIIAFILLGKYLEERARQQISASVRALVKLRPDIATRVTAFGAPNESNQDVPTSVIKPGDMLLVRAGQRIPVDGIVQRGASAVDQSLMTGESVPEEVKTGGRVIAGTLNLSGPLVVEAIGVGQATELARIIAMVASAQGSKAPIQRLADRVAGWFVPTAIGIALVTLAVWLFVAHDLNSALNAAVAVLVVACPCALGLATPVAIMAATGLAARMGILVRDAGSLETLHRVTAVVFDKTGTLTQGEASIESFHIVQDHVERGYLLSVARQLEIGSSHPLAQAIVRYAESQLPPRADYPTVLNLLEIAGHGVNGEIAGGVTVGVGKLQNYAHLKNYEQAISIAATSAIATPIALIIGDSIQALFLVSDRLRSDAKECIAKLSHMGITSIMASGDQPAVVSAIANLAGIAEFHAGLAPGDKATLIADLHRRHHVVAMAGDGINDAPALAAADVGIAMGGGTEVAIAAAGLTIRDNSIGRLVEAIEISRRTFRNIKENLFWAFAYNILLIPMAAFGRLSPMLAGAAMAASSLFVVANALRLRRL